MTLRYSVRVDAIEIGAYADRERARRAYADELRADDDWCHHVSLVDTETGAVLIQCEPDFSAQCG